MKTKSTLNIMLIVALAVLLMTVCVSPIVAQQKYQKSPGGYHGELDFPISWKQYYTYAEWTKIMHDIQKQYPRLADIESIGKSRMGREQYLITITAKSTGTHQDKTAMWVDGAIHGNEVNGITCSLYLMWYLLTRYDYDKHVYDLVNNCSFYILPGLNVDANDSFVRFPNTASNPREPFRPEDNDNDGLYDEDRTEDVDGDGELSNMYIEDPEGNLKLSEDKRRFIEVTDKTDKVLRFRRIGSEGYDNDGDGSINEDDIGGPDPNRNYPAGWNLQAGNPYPMSEPCTRNAYEAMLARPNIFASFHYHNTGRDIFFVAPRAVSNQNQTAEQRQRIQQQFENDLAELRKNNKYAQRFNRSVAREYREDLDAQTRIVTVGARILKNYTPSASGGNGMTPASSYEMLGAYAYLIELWGSPAFDADADGSGRVSDEEYLKWVDIELAGEGWIMPHTFNHPDLGKIWLGGSRKKHTQRTPPARYIEMEALKNAQFVMYCASQFPKVEIDELKVIPATGDLFWVDVTLKNDRDYPTISDRSLALKRVEKDKLTFNSSNNITLVEVSEGELNFDPLNRTMQRTVLTEKPAEFRLDGKQPPELRLPRERIDEDHIKKFRVLVKMDGSNGWVEYTVKSHFGGTVKKRVNIRVSE